MNDRIKRVLSYAVILLLIAQVLLVLVSWLLSASMTEGVHSLLSSEGIRWFVGQYVNMLASPLLVWLLLLSMAFGCIRSCGLSESNSRRANPFFRYRELAALRLSTIIVILYVLLILSMTVIPHAVLLSATCSLLPSAFTRAIVPILSVGMILFSVTYGLSVGSFKSVHSIVNSLSNGIAWAAPLFVLYVLLLQFYESLKFVFL
jgi:aminobenzoyl-glutamate transport protein